MVGELNTKLQPPRTSPSDCLVSLPGHSLVEGSYPSVEMQPEHSAAPAYWAGFP